jgi:hypothetical protein
MIAEDLIGRQRIITRGRFPRVEFIVGPFHFQCDEETVTVTKDTATGIEAINVYDYDGKGKKERASVARLRWRIGSLPKRWLGKWRRSSRGHESIECVFFDICPQG